MFQNTPKRRYFFKLVNENLNGETKSLLDGAHHEHGLDGTYGIGGTQHVHEELLVRAHVRAVNLKQVVKLSRYVVALCHLFHITRGLLKAVGGVAGHHAQTYAAEYHESQVQLLRVQYGCA